MSEDKVVIYSHSFRLVLARYKNRSGLIFCILLCASPSVKIATVFHWVI